jgi:hypothetical protein
MAEDSAQRLDDTFVTWKEFSKVSQDFEKRIGRVEGNTRILIAVALTNLAANGGMIYFLAEKALHP